MLAFKLTVFQQSGKEKGFWSQIVKTG